LLNADNALFFSAASVWEIAIKRGLNRPDFQVATFAPILKDPFDRMLIAQAMVEEMVFLTVDEALVDYSKFVRMSV
jgi:PIN domain nuclease of toxin-antitoxin system